MTTEHTVTEGPGAPAARPAGSRLRVPRSRGALSGLLLALLGIWGAIVPFVGPYFDFGYSPDTAWTWTSERGWLSVLPGCVALLAGLVIMLSANRASAGLAAWFAVAAGGWFVVGPQLAAFAGIGAIGAPSQTGAGMMALQALAYFYALGGVIVFFAAAALGRVSVRGVADARAIAPAPAPVPAAAVAPPARHATTTRESGAQAHRSFLHRRRDAAPASDDALRHS